MWYQYKCDIIYNTNVTINIIMSMQYKIIIARTAMLF